MTTNTNKDTRPGVMIEIPASRYPGVVIPYTIADEWMKYGRIGYEDHKSEWGCAVRLRRDDENNVIHVLEWEAYKIDASAAYWESIEGERQRHANELIEAGKEDELPEWNGLFHTHPIGSGASMSKTDSDQLKEMAAGGNWALSIISPANRAGVVDDKSFMAHYADSRDIGMVVVSNMKPKIGSAPKDDGLEEIRTHMKDIMVKVKKTPAKQITTAATPVHKPWNASAVYEEHQQIWDPVAKKLVDRDPLKTYPYRYETGQRDKPREGDWVYVDELDSDSFSTYNLEEAEILELFQLEGSVVKVAKANTDGTVVIDGRYKGIDIGWVLDPKQFKHERCGDDILVVARAESLDAKVLQKGIDQDLDPVKMGFVHACLKRANIDVEELTLDPIK